MKNLINKVKDLIDNGGYSEATGLVLNAFGAEIKKEYLRNGKHFADDTINRDIYKITLKRGRREFSFDFGQSVFKSAYYQDKTIEGRTYTTDGSARTGNFKVLNPEYLKNYCFLVKGTEPTDYDVVACLEKYDVGSFEDFCREFGYDEDSKKAEKIYIAVVKEYDNMCKLFSDEELEVLREIQ